LVMLCRMTLALIRPTGLVMLCHPPNCHSC
jgi:hypothetical protein